MIKKLIIIISLFLLSINVYAKDFNINSSSAIVLADDKILYQKESDKVTKIASLTKIMTAVVTIENTDDLNKKVTITKDDVKDILALDLASASLKEGDVVSINDLLYGLMLPSGGDAAYALARVVGGTKENFVSMMNKTAEKLALEHTHFTNPVGFDEQNNFSTARDLSTLFSYALENDTFKKIVTTDTYLASDNFHTYTSHIRKNSLVGDYLEGGKTGTTNDAGLCLASFAYDKDVRLMVITLNAPLDYASKPQYADAKTIYSYYINNYDLQKVVKTNEKVLSLSVSNAVKEFMDFHPVKDKYLYLPNDFNKEDLKYEYSGMKKLDSKIKKGDKIGHLNILYKGEQIYSENVYLEDNIKFSYIVFMKNHIVYVMGLIIFTTLLFIVRKIKKTTK